MGISEGKVTPTQEEARQDAGSEIGNGQVGGQNCSLRLDLQK